MPTRARILRPLAIRDFALLWSGMTVSLLGDGIYTVAIAWQVYSLSNAPTALAVVGAAWMIPQVLLLLVGGAVSDRFERRVMLMISDVVRGAAIAAIGVLSVAGVLELWHVVALVAVYGAGAALFTPSFTGIIRDIVPPDLLLEANSLGQFVRPLCVRFVGPALGGVVIGVFGVGTAFLLDAASFAVSTVAFFLIATRSLVEDADRRRSIRRDISEGIRYVRSQTWLWGTLSAVTIAMFFFLGPVYVLVPYIVKNQLDAGPRGLGLVLAAGGVGAIAASLAVALRGLPRHPLTLVYAGWSVAALSLVGYALVSHVWEAMIVSFMSIAGLTTGSILWATLMQRHVPRGVIGRVSSVDWVLSLSLAPLSYAVTGPMAHLVGVDATLAGAGIASAAALLLCLLLIPGVREIERA